MAKRLISFRELDDIEGLVEHHRKLQERLEALEADAAQFDTPVQGRSS
jgi:cell division septum initiation protein DivIVA